MICVSAYPNRIICLDQQPHNDHLVIPSTHISNYCVYTSHSFFREPEKYSCLLGRDAVLSGRDVSQKRTASILNVEE
jgi:hypothetical protein